MRLCDKKRMVMFVDDIEFVALCDWIDGLGIKHTDNFMSYVVKLWLCSIPIHEKKECISLYIKKTGKEKAVRSLKNYTDMFGG